MGHEMNNKIAVVTGASRGLGRAIAELFAAEGALVVLFDLRKKWVDSVAEDIAMSGGTATGFEVDVSDREAVHKAMNEAASAFGGIDVLVNNAMWNSYDPIAEITPEIFARMTGVGLGGVAWGIQAAAPHMGEAGGAIINIGSMAGRLGSSNALLYSAVKAGVDGMTRSASVELGKQNIRVNAIAPSTVATEGVMAILNEATLADRVAQTPIGRLGTTDDIAETALWLASDKSSFITGQSIAVDGGLGHYLRR